MAGEEQAHDDAEEAEGVGLGAVETSSHGGTPCVGWGRTDGGHRLGDPNQRLQVQHLAMIGTPCRVPCGPRRPSAGPLGRSRPRPTRSPSRPPGGRPRRSPSAPPRWARRRRTAVGAACPDGRSGGTGAGSRPARPSRSRRACAAGHWPVFSSPAAAGRRCAPGPSPAAGPRRGWWPSPDDPGTSGECATERGRPRSATGASARPGPITSGRRPRSSAVISSMRRRGRADRQEGVERGVPAVEVVAVGVAVEPAVVDGQAQLVAQVAQDVQGRLQRAADVAERGLRARPRAGGPRSQVRYSARPSRRRAPRTAGRRAPSPSGHPSGSRTSSRTSASSELGCGAARKPSRKPASPRARAAQQGLVVDGLHLLRDERPHLGEEVRRVPRVRALAEARDDLGGEERPVRGARTRPSRCRRAPGTGCRGAIRRTDAARGPRAGTAAPPRTCGGSVPPRPSVSSAMWSKKLRPRPRSSDRLARGDGGEVQVGRVGGRHVAQAVAARVLGEARLLRGSRPAGRWPWARTTADRPVSSCPSSSTRVWRPSSASSRRTARARCT